MMSMAKGKRVVVFLDYDGTLSPIVDDPDCAFMSDSMRSAVDKVAQHFPTCIISGRRRDKVYKFVKLTNVYYVGSHGMDIMAPVKSLDHGINTSLHEQAIDEKGNKAVLFQPAEEFLPIIEEVYSELERKTKEINGVMVENNKFCISVHFRRVDEVDWRSLEDQVINTIKEYPSLCITRGRKVIEIRPSIKWDKGRALEYLLEILGFASDQTLPLYIGDDRTDEDAFKVLQRRGQGYSIIVSSIPKDTKASYSLRDPSEVMSFLLLLSKWKKHSDSSRK
ncbi:putative trehalose-phosphate phosphatase 6 [Canna indica]|uniref:Trehalose 6-phosphate phosphatase n=1 Tax=Canna indica TaxID=4628 RepID=A0AAQ3K5B0_9LILI|nr:putative trehalose-phosphate phosphatase 6 [Canna indica]